jgi:SAM-dependent methyltransferase
MAPPVTASVATGIGHLARLSRNAFEMELFTTDRKLKHLLKQGQINSRILDEFAAHGCDLDPGSAVVSSSGWKWTLMSGSRCYVIRDAKDRLRVSRERFPRVSASLESARAFATATGASMANRLFFAKAAFRKRYLDRPDRVLINVGAGKWYAPNWKVIDYSAGWYRYNRSFIDYPLDLMQMSRFPFDDDSVDLFYSEHVFEHFPNAVGAYSFREMYRALKPGGGVRLVVPDADLLYDTFRARDERFFQPWMGKYNATMPEAFVILVGYPEQPLDDAGIERDFATLDKTAFFDRYTANLRYDYARAGEHINWFNFEKMQQMLNAAGFDTVIRSSSQASRFPEIRGPRFDTRPHYSLHIDAVK